MENLITFELCDYSNPQHLTAVAELLAEYMSHPMGDSKPHTKIEQLRLVDGLQNCQGAFVLLAAYNGEAIALATCFELFSTFAVKPFINIHDLIVTQKYRGKGVGRAMLEHISTLAAEKGCCMVSLEVREDNAVAQKLYRSEGFGEVEPNMLFWVKKL